MLGQQTIDLLQLVGIEALVEVDQDGPPVNVSAAQNSRRWRERGRQGSTPATPRLDRWPFDKVIAIR